MWKEISLPRIASIKKQMIEGLGMFSATAQADTIMSKKLRQQHLKYSHWLYHQPNIEQQRSNLFEKIQDCYKMKNALGEPPKLDFGKLWVNYLDEDERPSFTKRIEVNQMFHQKVQKYPTPIFHLNQFSKVRVPKRRLQRRRRRPQLQTNPLRRHGSRCGHHITDPGLHRGNLKGDTGRG